MLNAQVGVCNTERGVASFFGVRIHSLKSTGSAAPLPLNAQTCHFEKRFGNVDSLPMKSVRILMRNCGAGRMPLRYTDFPGSAAFHIG